MKRGRKFSAAIRCRREPLQGIERLIQVNGSPDFMFGKETSHELSYGKQLSSKVGRYIHKFLKKICSFLFGADAFRGNTRSHPEHDG